MTSAPRRRLVVVGGGITGLAAAWEASGQPDLDVTLLDSASTTGGKIRTSDIELDDGATLRIDEGADAFLARVPDAIDLCHELGLDDELTQPAIGRAKVFSQGALRFLPEETVLGVPLDAATLEASGILSPEGLRQAVAGMDPNDDRPPPTGDVAIGPFLAERYGAELVDRIVGPLIGGINAGDIDRLSLAAVTPQLADAASDGGSLSVALAQRRRTDPPAGPIFRGILGGSGRLVEALTQGLIDRGVSVLTGAAADVVEPLDEHWVVRGAATTPAGSTARTGSSGSVSTGSAVPSAGLPADLVAICTPAPAAARLLRLACHEASAELEGVEHSSVTLVTLVFRSADVPTELDASGFLVPRDEGLLMTAASWGSSKWAHWDDGRHVVLRVSAGRTGDERQLTLDDDELAAALRADLHTTMGIEAAPIATRISRWPLGFAQYTVGHLDRLDRIDAALADQCPTVAVTGAAARGLGLPACIRQGREAVRRLAER